MNKNLIFVFDCETVPDSDTLRKVFGYEGSDLEVAIKAQNEQEEKTGSSFLPVCFHKVVAISAVVADEFGRFLRVSTMEASSEKEIISKFLTFLNSFNPKLISFNGRGFDLPMLMIRAMKYNLSCPAYYDMEDKITNKNKWENYRQRYSDKFHIDLLDQISEYRSVKGFTLDSLCLSLGLPGKFDVSGDQVLELYYSGEIEKINEYCESDVLNTYLLFLKYEVLKGNITIEDYASYLDYMQSFIRKERANSNYTDIFSKFAQDEIARLSKDV
ncbi:putative polysaccharide biosynthesis protein [Campylobacter blaseri]|uniref:3'-5' exonuclease n=1 Tax=Campylobacter blaseri TaxID=2042961 RepID=A0A2P8R1H1_9BACT|nr:3'-5' exonuclease [Campylobacter blaseri]PSM52328.1 3'-5' exonuclease [Campylobacter blaseri]PSM54094.1 3'-5' exonuclease [Campylobacter blaseri]QKF85536.1 putative polysaccharide biosynthesis protein [Campylobacter blaseri]